MAKSRDQLLGGVVLTVLAVQGIFGAVTVSVPDLVEAEVGKSAVISCVHTIVGNPSNLLVEWFIVEKGSERRQRLAYRDRTVSGVDKVPEYADRVSVTPDYSLFIQEVKLGDERTFYCQVMAGLAGSGEGMAELKVFDIPEKPEVSQNAAVLSVTNPSVSEIGTCTSRNGYPAPNIIWYKDGKPFNTTTERNNDMYMVPRVVKEASGLYTVSSTLYYKVSKADKDSHFYCQVQFLLPKIQTQTFDSKDFSLNLHYYTENVNMKLMSPTPIKEGDDVEIMCEGDGSSPDYSFSWVNENGQDTDLQSGQENVLVLKNIDRTKNGTYRCEVLDFDSPPEIELTKSINIFVHYVDPVSLNTSGPLVVPLGDTVAVNCSTKGSDQLGFKWKKGKTHVSQTAMLSLSGVSYDSTGMYTCEARSLNVSGLHKERSLRIIVEGKPEIEEMPYSSRVSKEGEQVVLACTAIGHPDPKISWSEPGLQPSDSKSGNRLTSEVLVRVTPKLVQTGISCTATNSFGSAQKKLQLEIVPTTPVPTLESEANRQVQGGSSTAVIAVVICVLLLLLIVGLLFFLQKKGKLPCGKSPKKDGMDKPEAKPSDIVVEMKTDRPNEEAGLLDSNGEKRPPGGQPRV
ncbi:basal cell adhesion molecule [Latimeria chalumnae]|uniref:basal cell adhesion molecule n=1 Tax=Latimeria chalumnae TaxID=7897 RepID=UPI0003C10BA7|nr:PREDICTED: basal cell adhesion molecule [Latimeria chalumnae]|eukprot:XP_005999181.1 PREDICTED: basal cell adhesion molecule [Latimeria chalumnae]